MKTRKEINAVKKDWYHANQKKCRAMAKKSYLKHKEKRNAEVRAWALKNHDKVKEYHQKYNPIWYQKNKVARSLQIKEYAQNHKEDSVKRVQKYTAKNKEKVYAYGKEYNKTHEGRYRSTRSGASKRGKSFELSLEDFSTIVSQSCTYCGSDGLVGIDRIENAKGYTKENSAPCCKMCNYFKKNYTREEFLEHVKKIYLHNDKRK